MVGAAVVGIGAALYGNKKKSDAAKRAGELQGEQADKAMREQRYQFDQMKKMLTPYINAGTPAMQKMAGYSNVGPMALEKQKALAGLRGYDAQQAEISNIENSPLLQAQMRQGEEGILQNASATGGLRGGNVQGALAQFRPNMLNRAIEQQYAKLGGLTNFGAGMTQNLAKLGQASAAGVGAQGMDMATNIGGFMTQKGEAGAQAFLAQGKAKADMAAGVAKGIGSIFGGMGGGGGGGGMGGMF